MPGQPPLEQHDIRQQRDIGAFVSVPGALEQKLHADLDHLFFHVQLPPHYITMFLPGTLQYTRINKMHVIFIAHLLKNAVTSICACTHTAHANDVAIFCC